MAVQRLAVGLGRGLARVHQVTRPVAPQAAPRPWPLLHELPSPFAAPTALGRQVLYAARHGVVRDALDMARGRWGHLAWIHGDLSARTIATAPVDDAGTWELDHLVGLSQGGLGHPEWDVVCALAAMEALDPATGAARQVARTFHAAYLLAGGSARRPGCEWGTVLALVTAWDESTRPEASSERVEMLLRRAPYSAAAAAGIVS